MPDQIDNAQNGKKKSVIYNHFLVSLDCGRNDTWTQDSFHYFWIKHTTERKKYFHLQDVSQKQFRNRLYLS